MKKIFALVLALLSVSLFAQKLDNIRSGEVLTYKIKYGLLNAGTASLSTAIVDYKSQPHLFVQGIGKTSGAVKTFFKVEDLYQSFINYDTGLPSFYVRNVREGSYRQHYQTVFNHENTTLTLIDKKNPANKPRVIKSVKGVQDMLSAFYYLRSFDAGQIKTGTILNLNVWIDDEMFPFRLRVAGTENISTKFGSINCLKIVPSVVSGRVFKDKEGVTLWVTNDGNHIPVAVKAELAVGSLKAELDSYTNVKYPLNFK